jgi:hypothetical protein
MNALRGREFMHVSQMFFEQCEHIGSGGVVNLNTHPVLLAIASFQIIVLYRG